MKGKRILKVVAIIIAIIAGLLMLGYFLFYRPIREKFHNISINIQPRTNENERKEMRKWNSMK